MTVFHIVNNGDLYEVSLNGYVIATIRRYVNSSSLRQELAYDDLPDDVKEQILDHIERTVTE